MLDLRECLRVGPEDEQLTDEDASRVPAAHVALFCLLTASPRLEAEAATLKDQLDALAPPTEDAEAADVACFEGKLWRAPLTQLDPAVERACAAGRTPLLLDSTGAVDVAFLYQHATIIEAKQLVLEVRAPNASASSLAAARWGLRRKLVHALKWGHTLVIRLADTAPNFAYYCDPAFFPLALFDRARLPAGTDCTLDAHFKQVLRESDTAESGGHLFVPETFRVVLTSSFSPDVYEAHLGASLPDLETRVQPIVLFELSDAEREAQGLPALAPNDSQGVHPDAAGPVLGMAEAMSHWGDAKPMQFAKGELD